MAAPVFIGDAVTGAGYRLAGLSVRTPELSDAAAAFETALEESPPCIVLSAPYADALPGAVLEEALAAFAPPVLIVPDAPGRIGPPDWGARIRQRIMTE
ncbi:MAG: Vacuolar H+transporting two-sector ATPase F subunit [Alphaproteobacteria bacterium]